MFDFSIQEFLLFNERVGYAATVLFVLFILWCIVFDIKGTHSARVTVFGHIAILYGLLIVNILINDSSIDCRHYPELKVYAGRHGEDGIAVLRDKLAKQGEITYRDVVDLEDAVSQLRKYRQKAHLMETAAVPAGTSKAGMSELLAMFDAVPRN